MAIERLVVIGASSGGIDALRQLMGALPGDVGAPICVVSHTGPESPAVLDTILARAGTLPTSMARNGERLRNGHVFVAPPDHHLLIEPGVVCLSRGPKENRFRPAIDPLFRSAAQVYGPRVIGVVLTGNLDDGAAGLWAIRQLGGIAVVEDPATAPYPSMPANALRRVPDAHVAPLPRLAALLQQLLATSVHREAVVPSDNLDIEVRIAKDEPPLHAGVLSLGAASTYACPECHGALMAVREADHTRYRCHTGHAYSTETLLAAVSESIGRALGAAERALQESEMLLRQHADDSDPDFDRDRITSLRRQADHASRQAQAIRTLISERAPVAAERPA